MVQAILYGIPDVPPTYSQQTSWEYNREENLVDFPSQSAGSRYVEDKTCWFEEFYCWPYGPEEIREVTNTSTAVECQAKCNENKDCKYFTFLKVRGNARCSLMRGCSEKEPKCPHKESCSSGPKQCSCSKLNKIPLDTRHTSYARWTCTTKDGTKINPYEQDIPLTATCSAT